MRTKVLLSRPVGLTASRFFAYTAIALLYLLVGMSLFAPVDRGRHYLFSQIQRFDARDQSTVLVTRSALATSEAASARRIELARILNELAKTEANKEGKMISQSIWKPWVASETKMKVVSTLREVVYGYKIKTLIHEENITGISFSPDGKTIASASHDGTLKLWNSTTGKQIKTFKGSSNWNNSWNNGIAFFPDGKTIITASNDGTVKLWDITTGKKIKTHIFEISTFKNSRIPLPGSIIRLSSDGKTITYTSFNETVKQWNSITGKEITNFKTSFGMERSLVSSDAKIIVSSPSASSFDDGFKL